MILNKKHITLFLYLIITSALVDAQKPISAQDNLNKYWNYRDRLTNYFVKPGPAIGESIVATIRNKNKSSKRGFTAGDQTIDLAWYIGILATEYQLLTQNKQIAESTLRELNYAIMAFDRLDRCEKGEPWNKKRDTLDGFFHRYDVSLEDKPKLFSVVGRNKGLNAKDTWGTRPPGVPTYISGYDSNGKGQNYYSASVSQDQLIHLLMGFVLVYKCLPDTELFFYDNNLRKKNINFNKEAKVRVDRILKYYKNWIIKDPNGKNVERGQNSIMYAFPLATIGYKVNGISYNNMWSQSFLAKKLWGLSRVPNWENDFNSTMALALAALSDSWWDLTPLGLVNSTGYYISLCGKPWDREVFYLLLYQFVNDKKARVYDKNKTLKQIESAPYNGPYYWSQDSILFKCCGLQPGKPSGGWAFPNKFRGTKKEQEGLGKYPSTGNFSGIDYLLLYNLYHLIEQPIPYQRRIYK